MRLTKIVSNTFECPECSLMYYEGDIITLRKLNNENIHDCDNCLTAIKVDILEDKVTLK